VHLGRRADALCRHLRAAAFREYPGWEYELFPKPPDWQVPGEWVFARLMYPSVRFSDRPFTNWLYGAANWTIDYPRSEGICRRPCGVSLESGPAHIGAAASGDGPII